MPSTNARGIWLSLVTVACWAVLPITLRFAARHVDAYTVTWYRFVISAAVLALFLAARRSLPALKAVTAPKAIGLLLVATVGLVANYVLYLMSLDYVSPTIATVITQIGPLLLMFAGVWFFHERMSRSQWFGVLLLLAGLFLFFNVRLKEMFDLSGRGGVGALILIVATTVWAIYGVMQKLLLSRFKPQQILLLIYIGASLLLVPFAKPASIVGIPALELLMIVLSAANTLVAYGALAEALHDSGATIVGAVLAVGPVATLVVTWLSNRASPGFFPADLLNVATIAGACVVTIGSGLSARKR